MLQRSTEKVWRADPYLQCCAAKIVQIADGALELDRTVAYPEGGGQESDTGWLDTPAGQLPFVGAKLLYGEPIFLEGFQGGKSGGIIQHQVAAEHAGLLQKLAPGMDVLLHIDVQRRHRLTLSHSASHFLYAAAVARRPELLEHTIGCHIKENGARFDFLVQNPFVPEEVQDIAERANALMAQNLPIQTQAHAQTPDARTWVYGDIRIPCGGTHLESPRDIGPLEIQRKKLGKNKERLACQFPAAIMDVSRYHA